MRKFKCKGTNEEFDLDNPKTYSYLPKDVRKLRKMMLSEVGYFYCYVNFWHKEAFKGSSQKKRVKKLIKEFTDNEQDNYKNILWYQEQIFIFQSEIDNMC